MSSNIKLTNPLSRDGTSQSKRFLPSLDPDYIKLDERSQSDLIQFAKLFAREIQYYDLEYSPDGDWQSFFENPERSDQPHMSLFMAFLNLFGKVQGQLNQMTRRHLDFYFQDVLKLKRKPAQEDKVHILLECAKNVDKFKLDKYSLLSAGEDNLGNELRYRTDREIVVTPAYVDSLKSIFVDFDNEARTYASDATNSADGLGKAFSEPGQKWNAFGESQAGKKDTQKTMYEASHGFVISSPILLLNEGIRTVRITLEFSNPESYDRKKLKLDDLKLEAFFSGLDGWSEAKDVLVLKEDSDQQMVLEVKLGVDDESIIPLGQDSDESFNTKWPMIKLQCKKDSQQFAYEYLMSLKLKKVLIKASVEGLRNVMLQNDQSTLSPDKPFQPFGTTPSLGSTFYIGSTETFSKKLDELKLNIEWHEMPDSDLGQYYGAYVPDSVALNNDSFQAKVFSLSNKSWKEAENKIQLFNSNDASSKRQIVFETGHAHLVKVHSEILTDALKSARYSNDTQFGFLKLELTNPSNSFKAFGHRQYPDAYAQAILKKSQNQSAELPNSPYTPTIKSFSIDYEASQEIFLDSSENRAYPFKFFHTEPFGYEEKSLDGSVSLFPIQDYEGNLFIGIKELNPPQDLSCLFQVAEGSSDPSMSLKEKDIEWSYLSDEGWKSLSDRGKLFDSTGGLLTSGIITFQIPSDASDTHSLMPIGYHWLRSSIKKDSGGVARFIDVRAQAVTATFVNNNNDPLHLSKPLAAGKIKELIEKPAAIKSVQQPYASFNGKMEEQSNAFDTRVSERLRHKNRSVSIWDYERIVLEKFPSIYQVRCINHTSRDSEFVPGSVTLVVIPNLRNLNATNTLEPKVSAHILNEIKEYLVERTSPFVNIEVINPEYQQLLLDFKVGFHPEYDAGFYSQQLNEEIKRFLSPWAYDEGEDIFFGGKTFKSVVLTFVEQRPYVNFVNDFQMFHNITESSGIGNMIIGRDFGISDEWGIVREDLEVAEATSSRVILVSYPQHVIEVIDQDDSTCQGARGLGIGYMAVDIDFKVK